MAVNPPHTQLKLELYLCQYVKSFQICLGRMTRISSGNQLKRTAVKPSAIRQNLKSLALSPTPQKTARPAGGRAGRFCRFLFGLLGTTH